MKQKSLTPYFGLLCLFTIISAEKSTTGGLLLTIKTALFENGLPRLGYYDAAKLNDDVVNLYKEYLAKVEKTPLDRSTFSDLGKELFAQNFAQLLLALQTLYTKSLMAFDRVLELLVNIRKDQRDADLITGEAFIAMYNAIVEMDVKEDEAVVVILANFLNSMFKLNQSSVKTMYKLAKKHRDLQHQLEIHEDAIAELKTLVKRYANLGELPNEITESLIAATEPCVTAIMLGNWFGSFK